MTATQSVTTSPPEHQGRLQNGALGLPSVLFCIVTGAAPLTAMLFNVPVAVNGGGWATPAAFLLATVSLTIFSVGYIAMSRRVTSAGGFYTFVSRGLGRVLGLGSGLLIALCYMIFVGAVIGVMGYFAASTVETFTGLTIPAWVYMAIGLAIMSLLAWFHIELTAKVLGVMLVSEVLALLVLGVAVLVHGGAEGLSPAPFNPVQTTPARCRSSAPARRASRCSRPSGRGSASRWRPTTPRSPASPTGSPRSRPTARWSGSASSTCSSRTPS
jgi:amino acid transporter